MKEIKAYKATCGDCIDWCIHFAIIQRDMLNEEIVLIFNGVFLYVDFDATVKSLRESYQKGLNELSKRE